MENFLLQASIYLGTAVLVVPLAVRLGLGSVLGYLAAGILMGPVLGLAGAETADLQHFAEFGVVLMLFLIGLELEPKRACGTCATSCWAWAARRWALTIVGGSQSCLIWLGHTWTMALTVGMLTVAFLDRYRAANPERKEPDAHTRRAGRPFRCC
ncbi:MAG: cation:proton antiporter [Cypionkella sp.]